MPDRSPERAVSIGRQLAEAFGYLCALLLSAPILAFGLGVLALGHVIATRNPLVILYHALLAFTWGLPLLVLACIALVGCAIFRRSRVVASVLVVALDIGALVIVLAATGLPSSAGEAAFFVPTPVAVSIFVWIVASASRPGATAEAETQNA